MSFKSGDRVEYIRGEEGAIADFIGERATVISSGEKQTEVRFDRHLEPYYPDEVVSLSTVNFKILSSEEPSITKTALLEWIQNVSLSSPETPWEEGVMDTIKNLKRVFDLEPKKTFRISFEVVGEPHPSFEERLRNDFSIPLTNYKAEEI